MISAARPNILFTCAGRKVSLVESFRRALRNVGVNGRLIGTDASPLSAVLQHCDASYLVPRVKDPGYVPRLLDVCRREDVGLVVPLIDTDLPALAEAREQFAAAGALCLVSPPAVIAACRDKRGTAEFFARNDIPTVRAYTDEELRSGRIEFPAFIKPADGSGSVNAFKVNNAEELAFFLRYVRNPLVQEFARGVEYTVDALLDLQGRVINVVPRRRLEVRAGEISKGITVRDPRLIEATTRLLERLQGLGPFTVQCFLDEAGGVRFTEINARVGGGLPLTIAAGADYPTQIVRLAMGQAVAPCVGEFTDQLYMFRYEEAVYVPAARIAELEQRGAV